MITQSVILNIKNDLNRKGYSIHSSDKSKKADIKEYHWSLVNKLGLPSEHNEGKKDYIWEISAKQNTSSIKTYSEHSQKANLHTDSQYRHNPEKYFSLSSIQTANCGGGQTEILDFKNLYAKIKNNTWFKELYEAYPIAIPDVFQSIQERIIYQPIIKESPFIRFRTDTILKGLDLANEPLESKPRKAFNFLKEEILNSNLIERFYLKKGQIIIIDNHRVLHGRSAFQDSNRLLLRIRFN
jgi:alpha-ketoglutarate-dependent taurine dioxygenase